MIAIICVRMVVYTAETVVQQVRGNDEDHGKRQDPELVVMPYLFGNQQDNACSEQRPGQHAVVVLPVAMPEGIGSDGKGQEDHEIFKRLVLDDIDPENRQTR